MMKLRYTTFCTCRPLFMDFRGSVKIFSVKGGAKIQKFMGNLLSSGHHKNQGFLRSSSELCSLRFVVNKSEPRLRSFLTTNMLQYGHVVHFPVNNSESIKMFIRDVENSLITPFTNGYLSEINSCNNYSNQPPISPLSAKLSALSSFTV